MAAARPLVSNKTLDSDIATDGTNSAHLPDVMKSSIRPDSVSFVHSEMSNNSRQPYAVSRKGGHQTSAESWGTGRAISRFPRVPGGYTRRAGQGAFGNMSRGGRMFARTRIWRKLHSRININQKRFVVASAIAASSVRSLVMARGHKIESVSELPLVNSDAAESVAENNVLKKVGAYPDAEKAKDSKGIRPGKGKSRNRRYISRKGPLIVYGNDGRFVFWTKSLLAEAQRVKAKKEKLDKKRMSLTKTRNLLCIAIFDISYVRGLFPENYVNDKSVPALEMKIKKLMPMDAESRRLIDWMEKVSFSYSTSVSQEVSMNVNRIGNKEQGSTFKCNSGVYDALQKMYLKTLLFCVCETIEGSMIEEYAFSFSYSSSKSQEVSMNVNHIGNKEQGSTFKCNSGTDITPNQMRSSACKMVRTLIQLMRTLDKMPVEDLDEPQGKLYHLIFRTTGSKQSDMRAKSATYQGSIIIDRNDVKMKTHGNNNTSTSKAQPSASSKNSADQGMENRKTNESGDKYGGSDDGMGSTSKSRIRRSINAGAPKVTTCIAYVTQIGYLGIINMWTRDHCWSDKSSLWDFLNKDPLNEPKLLPEILVPLHQGGLVIAGLRHHLVVFRSTDLENLDIVEHTAKMRDLLAIDEQTIVLILDGGFQVYKVSVSGKLTQSGAFDCNGLTCAALNPEEKIFVVGCEQESHSSIDIYYTWNENSQSFDNPRIGDPIISKAVVGALHSIATQDTSICGAFFPRRVGIDSSRKVDFILATYIREADFWDVSLVEHLMGHIPVGCCFPGNNKIFRIAPHCPAFLIYRDMIVIRQRDNMFNAAAVSGHIISTFTADRHEPYLYLGTEDGHILTYLFKPPKFELVCSLVVTTVADRILCMTSWSCEQ